MDSDIAHKYGSVKGRGVKTSGKRTAEPVTVSYNPKTGGIREGKMAFDGGEKTESSKPSESAAVGPREKFIAEQINELSEFFKKGGEKALVKELMWRGFAQERVKNGKIFPGVKTGSQEIFEACKKIVLGEETTDKTNIKEGKERRVGNKKTKEQNREAKMAEFMKLDHQKEAKEDVFEVMRKLREIREMLK